MSDHPNIRFVFFGSSRISTFVLEELARFGYKPILNLTSAREVPPVDKLRGLNADVFIVASFGKILSTELIELPKYKSLNMHPSLLPHLRGPAPIQGTILEDTQPGITIIRMDEQMDHGPILAQRSVEINPWPDHYDAVEEKLGRAGGQLMAEILPDWVAGKLPEQAQEESHATYIKLIKKEDGLIDLGDDAEKNLRKVLAYSTWPGAYLMFKKKNDEEVRIVIKDAKIQDGQFLPLKIIPAGKREMDWQDFLRGN